MARRSHLLRNLAPLGAIIPRKFDPLLGNLGSQTGGGAYFLGYWPFLGGGIFPVTPGLCNKLQMPKTFIYAILLR